MASPEMTMEGYRRFGRRGTAAPASYDFSRLTACAAAAATDADMKPTMPAAMRLSVTTKSGANGMLESRRHLNRLRFAAIGKQKPPAS